MKIDSGSLPPDAARINQSQGATPATTSSRAGGPAAGSADAVQVSSSAQLAAEAARQLADATPTDEVRADVVERAKAALAWGELGTDFNSLADRMIDGMLDE